MCEYVKENQCLIKKQVCPYMYYCEKIQAYKESPSAPKQCKVKQNYETPKGACSVRGERKGYLYVDLGEETIKIKNPYDTVPLYVRLRLTPSGYKIRK